MGTFEILILTLIVAGFAGIFWYLRKNQKPEKDQSFLMIQSQMNELTRKIDSGLNESAQVIQKQFGHSAKIISEVTEKLTRVDEAARQTLAMNEQIKKLQNTLTNPKQRGVLGEYYLETVLKNVLPPSSYETQYKFKDGEIVDAVVFVDKKVIPIDSKFSLENYTRMIEAQDQTIKSKFESSFVNDLKMRINETSKYVRPAEQTMDFAFMFIPSEAIYYDLLINKVGSSSDDKNLLAYAGQKKVIIVSPTSFLAYLQTVLQGLRNQKISEQAQDIIKQVTNLGRHISAYEDHMKRLGKNLGTTVSMYNKANKELTKIDKDVLKISGTAVGIEPMKLDKPEEDE